jgi:hypothetical protein
MKDGVDIMQCDVNSYTSVQRIIEAVCAGLQVCLF